MSKKVWESVSFNALPVDGLRCLEQSGEQGDQSSTDENDTTASHELLDTLRLRAGVIVAVADVYKRQVGSGFSSFSAYCGWLS